MKHYLAIFAEDRFEALESFDTPAERTAYDRGLSRGAGLYSGSVSTYELPEQMDEMTSTDPYDFCPKPEESAKAVAAYEARDA